MCLAVRRQIKELLARGDLRCPFYHKPKQPIAAGKGARDQGHIQGSE